MFAFRAILRSQQQYRLPRVTTVSQVRMFSAENMQKVPAEVQEVVEEDIPEAEQVEEIVEPVESVEEEPLVEMEEVGEPHHVMSVFDKLASVTQN